MKFQQSAKLQSGLHPINIAPMINIIFLLLIFLAAISPLTYQPGISVKIPKAVTSDVIKEKNLVITITGEDVIYFNNALVTTQELKIALKAADIEELSILIKADRRSSMGRIVDVWDLCRILGIERINIATNQGS